MSSGTVAADMLDRKIDVCFGHCDQNGDGVLESADALALAARIIAYLDEPFGSAKAQALLVAFETSWSHLSQAMDTNSDGVVTKDEFRAGMLNAFASNSDSYDKGLKPLAEALLAICDKNGDGTVSLEEFAKFQKAFGTTPENSKLAFEKIDQDGDGTLTVDELLVAWKEYYTSGDPNAGGNWLFGDIFS